MTADADNAGRRNPNSAPMNEEDDRRYSRGHGAWRRQSKERTRAASDREGENPIAHGICNKPRSTLAFSARTGTCAGPCSRTIESFSSMMAGTSAKRIKRSGETSRTASEIAQQILHS